MARVKEVFWTAHPRVDVEYRKDARQYNTQTKQEYWLGCSEFDKEFTRQLAEVFEAEWMEVGL